jgi:hypothetical protein
VRGADRVVLMDETADPGKFRQLMTVAPAVNAARATVAYDQLGAGGDLFLAAAPCPSAPEVCGFARGSSAMIAGAGGAFDVFTVGSVDAGTRSLSPRRSFSRPYTADASIVEVDACTFRLDPQPDGSLTLVRQTAGGAVQPIADRVSEVRFAHVFEGRGVDVELQLRTLGSTASTITRRIAIVARNVR